MELPSPESIDDETLSALLATTIERLYSEKVVLRYTDHLSDRELYKIIYRDILPCCEKKVELPGKFLEWRCIEDHDTWLRYYADAIERFSPEMMVRGVAAVLATVVSARPRRP